MYKQSSSNKTTGLVAFIST